jgi:hypothetical protein
MFLPANVHVSRAQSNLHLNFFLICAFRKTNVMIKILHILDLFWVKNANFFAEFFGENI